MADLSVGVVGLAGKWSTEILADEVKAATGRRLIIDMAEVRLDVGRRRLLCGKQDVCELDALIVKKISEEYGPHTLDRLELLRIAEQAGVRVFSRVENMLRLVNRLSCTVSLGAAGIPMPETQVTESIGDALEIVKMYGRAVFKPLYSTKARGMCIIDAQDIVQAERDVRTFQARHPMMYIQKKLDLSGRDLGLVFLGGRYLGTYARVSAAGAWNTTINSGGRYAACQPSKKVIALAERAQDLFNMDFTTVDIAETATGPMVFEVSAFGGFRGAKEGIGINAAELYVQHVIRELDGGRRKTKFE